ncbi:DHH family phosphoesterase [uncultured Veillonella sp.]|uniref:DHH family phosphoesterase n=1 Tax=uncultured Veillonella sp. TaxID=159268 RepID=UPI0025ED7B40|nr:DHH family phosphoesterase [uncultured Veillonella sp.]MDY3973740.1 DHH family phosphoesterase [Veillonella caviae]
MNANKGYYGALQFTALGIVIALLLVICWLNWIMAIFSLFFVIVAYLVASRAISKQQKKMSVQLDTFAKGITQATSYAIQNLPTAIVIIDSKARVCWCNSVFRDWMPQDPDKTQRLNTFIPSLRLDKLWGKSGFFNEQIEERSYRIIYKFIEGIAPKPGEEEEEMPESYMAFYFDDITESEQLRHEAEAMAPAFGFLMMDNIEEVTKGLSDVEYTNLWAEINNAIVAEIDQYDGFVRNYTEDSYIFCISKESLLHMISQNFPLLAKVHNLETSRRIPATISIGIAVGEPSIKEQSERARSALELSLGRGGDQASVYVGKELKFFGGKTQGAEKNTRVRARVVAQAIKELMDDADSVIVMGHEREDYDSIGGAIGVAAMARAAGKSVHVAVSDQTVAIKKLSDLFPTEPGFESLLITPQAAEDFVTDSTLVFVVDVHRPDMVAAPRALQLSKRRVVIDHHRRASDFIEKPLLTYLEPASSSTSELVTELIQYFADPITLNVVEASALYAGIVVDTKNFVVQTGSRTFDAASFLRRSGADLSIVRHLFMESFDSMQLRAKMLAAAERFDGLALTECPEGIQNSSIVSAQAADQLITIEGIEASFVLYDLADGGIGVSARSQGAINVQLIMEALGGGGHRTVAGGQLYDMTMAEAREAVKKTAQEQLLAMKKEEETE